MTLEDIDPEIEDLGTEKGFAVKDANTGANLVNIRYENKRIDIPGNSPINRRNGLGGKKSVDMEVVE
jgi:hypothetical protein